MNKAISIIMEYQKSIDMRFLSEFLFHLKACSSYIEDKKEKFQKLRELLSLWEEYYIIRLKLPYFSYKDYILGKDIEDLLEISEINEYRKGEDLEKILGKYKEQKANAFERVYFNYRFETKKYPYFVSNTPKVEIKRIKEGSLELVVWGVTLSIFLLSSAMAYKIVKSRSVEFEFKLPFDIKINIKINDEQE